jgi:hypothetical protein
MITVVQSEHKHPPKSCSEKNLHIGFATKEWRTEIEKYPLFQKIPSISRCVAVVMYRIFC